MLLFIDTEFTNLEPGNKLISIALVDEAGNEFYAELTDTYILDQCSDFVKQNVLPYLRGTHQMTRFECSNEIAKWIDDRGVPCKLAMDNPDWDYPHLKSLLADYWPDNLSVNYYHHLYIPSAIENEIVEAHNFDVHNSLDDARIMRLAYRQLNKSHLGKI